MINRRDFLYTMGALTLATSACARNKHESTDTLINDVHSQLNPTRVTDVVRPESVQSVRDALQRAAREGRAVSIAGGRHAMGAQQFGTNTIHVDTRGLNRVLNFDQDNGTIAVEAGIQWPELVQAYLNAQEGKEVQWGIAQKQTGADRLSIGGSLAANAHGRVLTRKPMVADVESFTLVGPDGDVRHCSREENAELFALAIGGYGLFGVIATVTLRLVPRHKVERIVEVITAEELIVSIDRRVNDGFLYGDFQFAIDPDTDDFLHRGVFSCYRPVDPSTPIDPNRRVLSEDDWLSLLAGAHTNKTEAFERYVEHYLGTSGQVYWSDTHQMSNYLDHYHRRLDQLLGAEVPASEIIT